LPDKFHALEDRGMRRNAIKQQQLHGSQLQRNLDRVAQVTLAPGKHFTDTLLQDQLPAQNPHHQGGHQIFVERRERPWGVKQNIAM
jgi:hypothetical protein